MVLLTGAALHLRGGPEDGSVCVRPAAGSLAVDRGVRAPRVDVDSRTDEGLCVTTRSSPDGTPSERRLELGQRHAGFWPQIQATMRFADRWRPMQLTLNPAGGGAWLPGAATWNGLSVGTASCNTAVAFECRGNAVLHDDLALPGVRVFEDAAAAAAAAVRVGGVYALPDGSLRVRLT